MSSDQTFDHLEFSMKSYKICPLCNAEMKQFILNPNYSLIACSSEHCVFPLNLSMTEIHRRSLIVPISTADILAKMHLKMTQDFQVNPDIASFIVKQD